MRIIHKMFDNRNLSSTKEAVQRLAQGLHRLERSGWQEILSVPLLGIMDGAADLRCESWMYTVQEDLTIAVHLLKVEEQGPDALGNIVWKPHGNKILIVDGTNAVMGKPDL